MDFLNYLVKRGIIDEVLLQKIDGAAKQSGKDVSELLVEEGIDKENLLFFK